MTNDAKRKRASPDVISVEAAAHRLGIGRSLAYQLAREGKLPGVFRLGGRLLVKQSVLEHFLTTDDYFRRLRPAGL